MALEWRQRNKIYEWASRPLWANSPTGSGGVVLYDFNLWGQQKELEKLKYMHRNPVLRGLVACPEDWRWSS